MMRRFAGLLVLAVLLAACEKKTASSSSTPSTLPAPATTKIGPAGGRLEAGKARFEIPAGALDVEASFGFREVPAPAGVEADGAAFEVATDRALFGKPLAISLPVKLPFGASPDRISVLLSFGGATERLRGGTYDKESETFTIHLDRLFPLANADAEAPLGTAAADNFPVVMADVDPSDRVVTPMQDGVEWMILKTENEQAQKLLPGVRAALEKARRELLALRFPCPPELHVGFRPLAPSVGAHAFGGNSIEVNTTHPSLNDPVVLESALIHEYVHLVQQQMALANLRAGPRGVVLRDLAPGIGRWAGEGTAEFMAAKLCPAYEAKLVGRLRADFPLFTIRRWKEPDCHEYQTGIFFCWLDTLYDGVEIVRSLYSIYMTGRIISVDADTDRESGRGSWDPLNVLDLVLRTTPDRLGRTRTMRQAFCEFLIHLGWKKDFEPLVSNRSRVDPVLGPPGEVVIPDAASRLDWKVPDGDGEARTARVSATVTGDPWQIVKVIQITGGALASKNETGELKISIKPHPRMPRNSAILIVFPRRNVLQEPEIGNPANPVVIPEWENCKSATVWVVDLSAFGNFDIEVTAEMSGQGSKPAAAAGEFKYKLVDRYPKEDGVTTGKTWYASFGIEMDETGVTQDAARSQAVYEECERMDKIFQRFKWALLTVNTGGRVSYLYGPVHAYGGEGHASFNGDVLAPFKAGEYAVTAEATFLGKKLTGKDKVRVEWNEQWMNGLREKLAESKKRLEEAVKELDDERERLAQLRKEGAPANESRLESLKKIVFDLYLDVARGLADTREPGQARALAESALNLEVTDEDRLKICHRHIANFFKDEGNLNGYLVHLAKAGARPDWLEMAELKVRWENDIATAWTYVEKYEETGGKDHREMMFPKPGEEVLK